VGIDRTEFPESFRPAPGQRLKVEGSGGSVVEVQVVDVSDDRVTLDANHPLAGENLTFELELVEIQTRTA
jgi:FKBP-type peptidyl-prolyl cis-trans isomerase 2